MTHGKASEPRPFLRIVISAGFAIRDVASRTASSDPGPVARRRELEL